MLLRAALALALMLCGEAQAFAWGALGHSIVAEIAQRRLSKSAAAVLETLVGRASLASFASWADDYKFTPAGVKTQRWHYVDIDVANDDYLEARDCQPQAEGDCIVKALDREIAVLSDAQAPLLDRQTALRFVVHLMGDLTQPFHCSEHANDAGANTIKVEFSGKDPGGAPLKLSVSLHSLWDDGLIDNHAYSWGAYLDEIETTTLPAVGARAFGPNAIANWTNDCHAAGKAAYGLLPAGWEATVAQGGTLALDAAYQKRAQPLLDQQLAIGGVQLAAVLNAALGSGQ